MDNNLIIETQPSIIEKQFMNYEEDELLEARVSNLSGRSKSSERSVDGLVLPKCDKITYQNLQTNNTTTAHPNETETDTFLDSDYSDDEDYQEEIKIHYPGPYYHFIIPTSDLHNKRHLMTTSIILPGNFTTNTQSAYSFNQPTIVNDHSFQINDLNIENDFFGNVVERNHQGVQIGHYDKYAPDKLTIKARDNETNRVVNITRITFNSGKKHFKGHQAVRELLFNLKLNHPNLAKCIGYWTGADPSDGYIRQIYLAHIYNGPSLYAFKRAIRSYNKNFTTNFNNIGYIMNQITKVVNFLHSSNIIHRDLSVRSFTINPKTLHVELQNFGMAKDNSPNKEDHNITVIKDITRTVPPEVNFHTMLKNTPTILKPYTKAIDIYAIGCILSELFMQMNLNHYIKHEVLVRQKARIFHTGISGRLQPIIATTSFGEYYENLYDKNCSRTYENGFSTKFKDTSNRYNLCFQKFFKLFDKMINSEGKEKLKELYNRMTDNIDKKFKKESRTEKENTMVEFFKIIILKRLRKGKLSIDCKHADYMKNLKIYDKRCIPTEEDEQLIIDNLNVNDKTVGHFSELIILMIKLTKGNPDDRPTAAEVLENKFLVDNSKNGNCEYRNENEMDVDSSFYTNSTTLATLGCSEESALNEYNFIMEENKRTKKRNDEKYERSMKKKRENIYKDKRAKNNKGLDALKIINNVTTKDMENLVEYNIEMIEGEFNLNSFNQFFGRFK